MSELIDYYMSWPHLCNCPHELYKRIRKCMVLDRPEWFYNDGRPGRRKPYKMSNGEYRMFAHFEEHEYVEALKAIIRDYETNPIFIELRAEDFNSIGQHRFQTGYISEDRYSDLRLVEFGEGDA